ncbi:MULTISPECIES: alkaline shock response membrane anchor protein AmaP [unclassified Brevibacterium]|uniref:alkaline shock response membrane anchor protein AmaP n=1 Tax=unclassified Brevibacterium TaxID=2614124 RepID=UPI001F0DBE90|nr:alkaline shock response membrane anchor protein AmaP [Brevibacterium sp. S22]
MSDESVDATDAHLRGIIDEYMGAFEPDPEESVALRERIFQIVREDAALAPATKLTTEHGNPFRISTAEVRGIVRRAVDAVPGIRARSVTATPTGDPEGSAVDITLTVAMRAGTVFVPAAEEVRGSVADALTAELGIPAMRIDITVEDVFAAEEAADG